MRFRYELSGRLIPTECRSAEAAAPALILRDFFARTGDNHP